MTYTSRVNRYAELVATNSEVEERKFAYRISADDISISADFLDPIHMNKYNVNINVYLASSPFSLLHTFSSGDLDEIRLLRNESAGDNPISLHISTNVNLEPVPYTSFRATNDRGTRIYSSGSSVTFDHVNSATIKGRFVYDNKNGKRDFYPLTLRTFPSFDHVMQFVKDNVVIAEGENTYITFEATEKMYGDDFSIYLDGNFQPHLYLREMSTPITLKSYGITSYSSIGDGILDFRVGTNTSTYTLEEQEILLRSSEKSQPRAYLYPDKSLKGEIEHTFDSRNKSTTRIYGAINSAFIDGFNLFPNFYSWYIENVYTLPLSIVSAIFAGVELTRKKRA